MSIYLASELWFSAQEKGGGTFKRWSGEEYEEGKGYVVGGDVEGLKLPKDSRVIGSVEAIAAWIDKTRSPYVGSWVDYDTIYVDGCDVVIDRDEAIALGKERNQIAIWDLANNEELRIKDVGHG